MDTIETENRLGLSFCERLEIAFTHGQGSTVWDESGKAYLDFTSGWGVTCLGHSHPVMTKALSEQAGRIIQNPNAGFTYAPSRAALLNLLQAVLPATMEKVYFCNSGAEANDACLKLARKITGRTNVISTLGGFHGRTFTTLAVTRGLENAGRFTPGQSDTVFVPFGDAGAIAAQVDSNTAAVILEPVQGEGGVQIPPPDYLAKVAALCKTNGTMFIVDEIQTGYCRTGKFFALAHATDTITPDFLTLGKGIAGGFPFAAFAVSERVSQQIEKDDHGGTYCGNPLGCAISFAVTQYLIENNVAGKVAVKEEQMLKALTLIKNQFPELVREIRGKGLLCAFEFFDHNLTKPFTHACAEAGLLVVPTRNGIIQLLPDLLVTEEDIATAFTILEKVLAHS